MALTIVGTGREEGRGWRRFRLQWPRIFSISCSFLEIWQNRMLAFPLRKILNPPLLTNPFFSISWKREGNPRHELSGADPGGARVPPDPRFWGPKIEHFWALFNFSIIFFDSLHSAYYYFNMLLFQSSNSKIFQPRFTRHRISHLEVFVFSRAL